MLKVLIVACFVIGIKCALPPNIPKCKKGDTECIKESANYVLRNENHGDAQLKLQAFDPLHITRINLKQGGQSPVNIELNFKDVDLTGLSQQTCTLVKGFGANPEGKYELKFRGPQVTLVGPYTINGRILVLPINGNGKSNFTLIDPELHIKFTGKTKVKNGKTHLYTDDMRMTIKVTHLYSRLTNLYNGDRALGDSTNQFLNDNWRDIFNELKGSIAESFALITQAILNDFWSHHDYNEMFLA